MNGLHLNLWLIPLLPLAGFLVNGILGRRLPKWQVTAIALAAPAAAFCVVAWAATLLIPYAAVGYGGYGAMPYTENLGRWIQVGALHIDFSFVLDQLSLIMLLVVTGVGFLIHVYSVGYMSEEAGYARYFSYLNLFLFFMTVLVLAGNALVMFIGWEGVGLTSYLLIGFYFNKQSAAAAGKKAFLVNRVGDFGFLIGIFLLLTNFGTLTFSEIAAKLNALPAWQGGILTITALCLLLGATGKSAQLPLYIWLPDAMEGPTPVSALIHAATMVTAGVYMIARTHVLFDHAPTALAVVAIVGGATAIFAASIALVQTDIKRVLAYSTISQLGYMFLAAGVAAYSAAIFHLITHAFFKALLFLAAGSVIHGLSGEQDLRRMGGLWKKLPITFATMTVGVLAIAGLPPLAGFYSKDAILLAAFEHGPLGLLLYLVGLVTALLTSFYMFRLWYLAFFGASRSPEAHPHESPWTMLVPLILLATLSICGGWIGIEHFAAFLKPVTGLRKAHVPAVLEWTLMGVAVAMALLGWIAAHVFYKSRTGLPAALAASWPRSNKLLVHKYWVDEIYSSLIVKPLLVFSRFVLEWVVEFAILGGAAWLVAEVAQLGGALAARWQSGNLRSYAAWLAAGAAVLLLVFFFAGGGVQLLHAVTYVNHSTIVAAGQGGH
jgi:NADH-quinone oxidoreductase subunit L